jgi:hypothetical protein
VGSNIRKDPMEQNKYHQTLFRAAEKGDLEAVRELLHNGAIVDGRLGPLND